MYPEGVGYPEGRVYPEGVGYPEGRVYPEGVGYPEGRVYPLRQSVRILLSGCLHLCPQYVPSFMNLTILDSPCFVVDGIAMIGFPCPSVHNVAPRMKSICPPTPANTHRPTLILNGLKSS